MREILFRGKRVDNNKWEYGNYYKGVYGKGVSKVYEPEQEFIIDRHTGVYYKIKPETIGQYTGIDDANGNKIFEGDIVKVELVDGEYFTTGYVRKDEASYAVFGYTKGKVMNASDSYEILGNTTDNPELLKDG